MTVEIFTLGGYNEVGRNMTAVKVGHQVIILDMGFSMEKVAMLEDSTSVFGEHELITHDVIPDDRPIAHLKNKVSAIVASHGHLDHIGAIPILGKKYNAPVLGTPFTTELILEEAKERGDKLKKVVPLTAGEVFEVGDIAIEFVHTTHSIPQTIFTAIHTNEGVIFYGSDFKFDNFQALSRRPDYKRLRELGKEGVRCLIAECIRADEYKKTPSETVAKELLRNTLTETMNEDKGIVITSFSSHIERLTSILEASRELDRKLIFAGRSLSKYVKVAERIGIKKFPEVEIVGKPDAVKKAFAEANRNKGDYIIVATGSQGEPTSVLSRIVHDKFDYKLDAGDEVIFSCNTIPNPTNIENRRRIEEKILSHGARVFQDVHVSGHAAREDHRDLLNMLQPEHVIPCHAPTLKQEAYARLALDLNQEYKVDKYTRDNTIHLSQNGKRIEI